MPEKFILNDESKYNSYGFRVLNTGIDLDRFRSNPVMLDGHNNSNDSVIGKWNNIQVDGAELSAEPEFDSEDEKAQKIDGKVKRGYIKGASLGLLFNHDSLQLEPNGKFALMRTEVIEASIVPVPSNAGALRLYVQQEGKLHLMSEEEIKLSVSNILKNNNYNNMKKVFLSAAALLALGLENKNTAEGVDADLIEKGINDLKAKLDAQEQKLTAAQTALKTLQANALAAKKTAAEKIVADAIAEGKIDATAKEDWLQLALSNEALATSTLNALPAKTSLAAQVNNQTPAASTVKTADDFEKLPLDAQLSFKANNPEAYKKLFA